MKKLRNMFIIALSLVLVAGLAACGGASASSSAAAPETPAPAASEPAASAEGLRIAIVTSNGINDNSFGEEAYNGIAAFIANHPDAQYTSIEEPDIGKVVDAAAQVIADYDVLVLPGYQYAPIGPVALLNPETKIILIDSPPQDADGNETTIPNVYSMCFKEHESGFFAGLAAALETKTGKIAILNGQPFPSNVNYQFGFMAGVKYANAHYGSSAELVDLPSYAGTDLRDINVGGNYVGSFTDPASGKVVANALINEGVDIIFVAAGLTGTGAFAAAKEAEGVMVIGVDMDQYDDGVNGDSNIVLTSALKVMSINVERQLENIYNGTFEGRNDLLDASTGSTGYAGTTGRHQLSDDTLAKLEEAAALLANGTIIPPDNFSDFTYDNFPGL